MILDFLDVLFYLIQAINIFYIVPRYVQWYYFL
jgi:hypothetical protein